MAHCRSFPGSKVLALATLDERLLRRGPYDRFIFDKHPKEERRSGCIGHSYKHLYGIESMNLVRCSRHDIDSRHFDEDQTISNVALRTDVGGHRGDLGMNTSMVFDIK